MALGFFRRLFGGTEAATPPQERSDKPNWTVSARGNQTAIAGDSRITVFQDGDFWKYCITRADDDDDSEPYYSGRYQTKDAAQYEAQVYLFGGQSRHQTTQEVKLGKLSQEMPAMLEKEIKQMESMEAAVAKVQSGNAKRSRLENLEKQLLTRASQANNLRNQAIETNQPTSVERKAEAMRDRYFDLRSTVTKLKASATE